MGHTRFDKVTKYFIAQIKMVNSGFPLVIHNNTNEQMTCRYMRNGAYGENQVTIAPRDKTMITDSYGGMILYASTAYDPSTVVPLTVKETVDEVYFGVDGSCGFGKGSMAAIPSSRDTKPTPRRRPPRRPKSKEEPPTQPKETMLPGGDGDQHGVSLDRAHASDLTKQGHGQSTMMGQGEEPDADDTVYIPGLGEVPRSSVPPEVMKQVEARHALEQQHHLQAQHSGSAFPDYSSQQRAAQLDNVTIPPITLKSKTKSRMGLFGPLTRVERYIASSLHSYCNMSLKRSDMYARPLFLAVLVVLGCLSVVLYRKYKAKQVKKREHSIRRR